DVVIRKGKGGIMNQLQPLLATARMVVAVVAVLAGSLMGTSVAHAADAVCNGSFSGPIPGNPYGGSTGACTVSQANIGGNVQLKPGARIVIDGRQYPTYIGGSVLAQS